MAKLDYTQTLIVRSVGIVLAEVGRAAAGSAVVAAQGAFESAAAALRGMSDALERMQNFERASDGDVFASGMEGPDRDRAVATESRSEQRHQRAVEVSKEPTDDVSPYTSSPASMIDKAVSEPGAPPALPAVLYESGSRVLAALSEVGPQTPSPSCPSHASPHSLSPPGAQVGLVPRLDVLPLEAVEAAFRVEDPPGTRPRLLNKVSLSDAMGRSVQG